MVSFPNILNENFYSISKLTILISPNIKRKTKMIYRRGKVLYTYFTPLKQRHDMN